MLSHGKLLAALILLVSIFSLLGVQTLATQSTTESISASTVTVTQSMMAVCYSSKCPVVPFSAYYGVARVVLDVPTLQSLTFTINLNSTAGPAYIEQLQMAFYNGQYTTPPTVTSYWTLNGGLGFAGIPSNGVLCGPTSATLYPELVNSCDLTFRLLDPLGNVAIAVGPGSHNAPSAGIAVSIDASGTNGQLTSHPLTIIATVVAPTGANVTISD